MGLFTGMEMQCIISQEDYKQDKVLLYKPSNKNKRYVLPSSHQVILLRISL